MSGTTATFEEESTHLRVDALNTVESFRSKERDHILCVKLRAKHIKLSRKENNARKKKLREEQLPKSAGDLHIIGEDGQGNLRYGWKGVEILVTPVEKRKPLPEKPSKKRIFEAKESTPQEAFRKMKEKVMRMLAKQERGDCERIIAKNSALKSSSASTEDQAHGGASVSTWATHKSPALGKLDDPVVRSHLRDAFSYLNTMQLHHCQNCDEVWPVFTGAWPQGGVDTAGPKAGYSETIQRAGWMASSKKPELCYRCYSSKLHRNMYSEGNLQHLGERHEPLSNLTWFESLLIARVHPVISVVTLTATGLLCYAGHVL